MRDKERYISKHSRTEKCVKTRKTRKSSLKTIIFSVVALIQIILIMVAPTSAWVETISSIMIEGKGNIDTPIYNRANVGSGSGYDNVSIDLNDYFKKAGNVHLSSASSANGKDFYFPVISTKSGSTFSNYRKGTINDKNVNYIDFSFEVHNNSNNVMNYFFADEPTVKLGGTEVTDSSIRIAFTIGGNTTIFAKSATTGTVVDSITGGKSSTTVKAFSERIKNAQGTNSLFQVSANATIEINVKMWLQDENANLTSSTASVENFSITTGEKLSRVKVEYIDSYGLGSNVSDMGDISASANSGNNVGKEIFVSPNTEVTLNATSKNGYGFIGWYTSSAGTTPATLNNNKFSTVSGKDYTFYAMFKKSYTLNLVARTDGVNSGTGGTVKINSGTAAATATAQIVDGEQATITAEPKTGYDFVGWYDDLGEEVSLSSTEKITVTNNRTLYAYFQIKTYTVKAMPSPSDKGSVTFNNTGVVPEAPGVKVTIKHGDTAHFVAQNPAAGYEFKGWYENASCTGSPVSTSATYDKTITGDYTLWAKFDLKTYTVKLYAMSNGSQNSTYGKVQLNTGTASTYVTGTVTYGNKVTYTAVENDYCTFNGWYDNSACTGTAVSSSATYTINSFDDNSKTTLYAKFTITTKTITATVKTDSGTGPTVKIDTGSESTTSTSKTVNLGASVTLTADKKTGYSFVGWYTNANCTGTAAATSETYTINPVTSSTSANFYAKFEKVTMRTIYLVNNAGWSEPYAHLYHYVNGGSADVALSTWPGVAMTKVSGNIWSVTFDPYYESVIFSNNGSSQTSREDTNLHLEPNNYFYLSTKTWGPAPAASKTITVGVINYIINENFSGNPSNCSTFQVYYWNNSGDNGNASCTYTGRTTTKQLGSSYWGNAAQTFYLYTAEVPLDSNPTGFKFHAGDRWFGSDGNLSTQSAVYVFNYSGDKANYE
ncbi:MAG: InlB B-repeat-containing protein [Oscillospiraceae bacterium]|nr:InlB B-repeat-containing protein [Oscillospiraceae bacterium]